MTKAASRLFKHHSLQMCLQSYPHFRNESYLASMPFPSLHLNMRPHPHSTYDWVVTAWSHRCSLPSVLRPSLSFILLNISWLLLCFTDLTFCGLGWTKILHTISWITSLRTLIPLTCLATWSLPKRTKHSGLIGYQQDHMEWTLPV